MELDIVVVGKVELRLSYRCLQLALSIRFVGQGKRDRHLKRNNIG